LERERRRRRFIRLLVFGLLGHIRKDGRNGQLLLLVYATDGEGLVCVICVNVVTNQIKHITFIKRYLFGRMEGNEMKGKDNSNNQ
jgi:hypothetical protein